ncbi:hypothetical protein BT69DRAFT_1285287 [Atractiella rhizophila]|nr:hypothetical protein BT69DRAFT_1285287 [Atractiella rhizophila]
MQQAMGSRLSYTDKQNVRFLIRQLEKLAASPIAVESLQWSECLSHLTTAEYLRKTVEEWDDDRMEASLSSLSRKRPRSTASSLSLTGSLKSRLISLDPLVDALRARSQPTPVLSPLSALRPTGPPPAPLTRPSSDPSATSPSTDADAALLPPSTSTKMTELDTGLIPVDGDSRVPSAPGSPPNTNQEELPPLTQPSYPRQRTSHSHAGDHRRSSSPPRSSHLLEHHHSVQDTLTSDLASMARQLKLNSLHFGTLMEKDKEALEGAERAIQGNFDRMNKQGGRLKVLNKTSGGTTWLMVGILGVVVLVWFFMFMIIRFF